MKFLGDKNLASAPELEIQSAEGAAIFNRASMHGAPLWARFMTVAAGPVFNFIFSGLIFFLIFINQGVTKLPLTVDKVFGSPYDQLFEKGDVVHSVNGIVIENDLNKIIGLTGEPLSKEYSTYVVERNGSLETLKKVIQNPPRISQVLPKSSAIAAGLEKGDSILS